MLGWKMDIFFVFFCIFEFKKKKGHVNFCVISILKNVVLLKHVVDKILNVLFFFCFLFVCIFCLYITTTYQILASRLLPPMYTTYKYFMRPMVDYVADRKAHKLPFKLWDVLCGYYIRYQLGWAQTEEKLLSNLTTCFDRILINEGTRVTTESESKSLKREYQVVIVKTNAHFFFFFW